MRLRHLSLAAFAFAASCSPQDPQTAALTEVKQYIQSNLNDLHAASLAICAKAPTPDADGWNTAADNEAVMAMRAEWKKARVAYEHVEGAIAVLFQELDAATDARYDNFVTTKADNNLFDGEGVTGVHAIERILWAGEAPARVTAFETEVPNSTPPAQPANLQQATDFKNGLCRQLVTDVDSMRTGIHGVALDTAAAFRGVIGSIGEQQEKAQLAAVGEEESRYAQFTLADMRANVEGGLATFEAFEPWLISAGAKAEADAIRAGLKRLSDEYAKISGDALPPAPAGWSNLNPAQEHLATPFGQLWSRVAAEADDKDSASAVSAMNRAAEKLGIPQLPEE